MVGFEWSDICYLVILSWKPSTTFNDFYFVITSERYCNLIKEKIYGTQLLCTFTHPLWNLYPNKIQEWSITIISSTLQLKSYKNILSIPDYCELDAGKWSKLLSTNQSQKTNTAQYIPFRRLEIDSKKKKIIWQVSHYIIMYVQCFHFCIFIWFYCIFDTSSGDISLCFLPKKIIFF